MVFHHDGILPKNANYDPRAVYRGRKRALTAEQVQILRQRAQAGEAKTALAQAFGISRETVYQYLRHSESDDF